MGSGKLDKLISSFLVVDEVEGKWIDLFDYLIINYTAKYKKIYKSIIIETVKLMGLFERKYIHVFATVIQKIDRLIYLIFENNTKHILVFKEEVLFSISSVSLRMQYFMLNNFFKSVVNNNHLREIQDKLNNSITRNKEASVESFSLLSTHYLYSYIRNWHCNEELPLEDPLVKERVAEFSPFVFGNINYFWQFIGNDLKNNLEIVISRTSFMLKDHENNINYFLTLWGKEAICNFILEKSKENNAPKNIIELKSLLDEYIKREESKKKEAAAEEDDDDTM